MGSVAIAVNIRIILRDGLAPACSALKVNMVNVGSGINDIDVNTLATVGGIQILVICAEAKSLAVRNASKTPWSRVLNYTFIFKSVDNLVLLDKLDLKPLASDDHVCSSGGMSPSQISKRRSQIK